MFIIPEFNIPFQQISSLSQVKTFNKDFPSLVLYQAGKIQERNIRLIIFIANL